jgi:hypothetical protein
VEKWPVIASLQLIFVDGASHHAKMLVVSFPTTVVKVTLVMLLNVMYAVAWN